MEPKSRTAPTAALIAGIFAAVAMLPPASAQQAQQFAQPVTGWPYARSTNASNVVIVTANTFQTMLPVLAPPTVRQRLFINNNNTQATNCFVFFGTGTATVSASFLLQQAQSYTREWPFVPSDQIQVTCNAQNGTLFFDTQ
jgi:hypothetical protein